MNPTSYLILFHLLYAIVTLLVYALEIRFTGSSDLFEVLWGAFYAYCILVVIGFVAWLFGKIKEY